MCFKVEVEGGEWDSCDDGVQCPVSVCVVRMFFGFNKSISFFLDQGFEKEDKDKISIQNIS